MTKVVQVTSYNELSKLLSAAQDSITIIEFYDTSNGICNLLSPRIQSKINCSGVKIKLVRVDVLICPELHVHYKISKLPTVIGLRGSQVLVTDNWTN
ncbi:hypothetical protein M3Y97_00868000 [Aphelenchoides bicaudatus]|nr:hypothetical protein M3Y97_00868000 [Aphelenchoides bicaudatus]